MKILYELYLSKTISKNRKQSTGKGLYRHTKPAELSTLKGWISSYMNSISVKLFQKTENRAQERDQELWVGSELCMFWNKVLSLWVSFYPWHLEKNKTKQNKTHSSIRPWRTPWTEEPWGLYSPWDCKESDMTEWLTLILSLTLKTNKQKYLLPPKKTTMKKT